MKGPAYSSVPLADFESLEAPSDGEAEPAHRRGQRRGLVAVAAFAGAALLGTTVMFVAPIQSPNDGYDEWITLAENVSNDSGNESGNEITETTNGTEDGSEDGSASNGSGNESSNRSATGSANESVACSGDWKGCLESKCCENSDFRCYKKNDKWAQCRNKCTPGIDEHDKRMGKHATRWSCDDWDKTPGKCAGSWEGCLNTKCCKNKKQRCFKKNDHWAQCRDSCKPGIDEHDKKMGKHLGNWSCEKFDDTPDPANCSADVEENCWETRCCANAKSTCFKKDNGWAGCNETCTEAIWDKDPKEHQRPWKCDLV